MKKTLTCIICPRGCTLEATQTENGLSITGNACPKGEKYATDELTGLIGAAALMRPTGISDMEAKSVVKKFKDKKFAAGCSRDVIRQGAEMLGMELNELIARTLEAMKA